MSKPTLREKLPLPSESANWPQELAARFARGEATRPTLPFVHRDNGEGPIEFEWTATGRDGQSHDFFLTFRSGGGPGLPGPTADRVLMALFSMSPGRVNENLRVETHLSELAGLCRFDPGRSTSQKLLRAIDRLQDVTIETNAFWDRTGEKYMDKSVISLLSCRHANFGPDDAPGDTEIEVHLTSAATDFMSTWAEPVNLDHLLGLDSCMARKLYQVSSLAIYQQGEMVEGLKTLSHEHLGISRSRKSLSQLSRSLRGPIRSLREKNLIDIRIEEGAEYPSIESDWVVRARPMRRVLEAEEET